MLVTIITVVHLLSCLALIGVVLLQSGKKSGLAAVSGGSESYLSKNRAQSLDARLARWTKWFAIAFAVMTLVLNIIIK